ncbi:MAG: hypothetical protein UT66_C0048G0004 [candidate division CPR2 bacterium GW2011_GWC1_39_9]|uniref:Uncharacterized protein n=1 Tax=candidate division CPR2 bacterium GW2011_GWC2_39_10 TaxID=1618345 RepID=A0A0G0P6U1_UNCC2|nr:MAG: hypothetical protein UT18_C0015G0003 [candidate division CPR2 bacterium GW2011_GWC2_39_10]KKR32987.1 MAG: hypothetical protein UT66_C0048G0004 [candidate division CPR2 bacterium GW2011_GWC1_39_9]
MCLLGNDSLGGIPIDEKSFSKETRELLDSLIKDIAEGVEAQEKSRSFIKVLDRDGDIIPVSINERGRDGEKPRE